MVIKNAYYEFYRNTNGYYVRAVASGSTIYIVINEVINGTNKEISTQIVGETATLLTLPSEAIYNIVIGYDVSGSRQTVDYTIKEFPTLKTSIVENLKDAICKCSSNIITSCSTSELHPTIHKVYDTQLIYNSITLYRHLLLPLQFSKMLDCCINELYSLYSERFINDLETQYNKIQITGNPVCNKGEYERNLAIMYLVLYHSEIIVSEHSELTDGATAETNDELDGIDTLFNIGVIEDCYTDLGLDFDSLYTLFRSCASTKSYLTCDAVIVEEAIISNLLYDTYSSIKEVNVAFDIAEFTWGVSGSPLNLMLSDNEGTIVNQPVFGISHQFSPAETYTITTPKSVTWTLDGDNVKNAISVNTKFVYAHYYGKNVTGNAPTPGEISAGTKVVSDIYTSVTMTNLTSNSEYGWFAIPDDVSLYNTWKINDPNNIFNQGSIGAGQFIKIHSSKVSVDGIDYNVYLYAWASEVLYSIKLYRV